MKIAVFADVHGRILLCFKLCARWQRETGEQLDLILQAGDLGVYPDRARLDKATIRHAERDPSELGFLDDFAAYRAEVAAVLAETRCPLGSPGARAAADGGSHGHPALAWSRRPSSGGGGCAVAAGLYRPHLAPRA
jgi:hypothetical protein